MTLPVSESTPSPARPETPQRLSVAKPSHDDVSLQAIDDLLATYARRQEEQAAHVRAALLDQHRFAQAAACTFERVVKPAFRDIVERLTTNGGGGLIQERPAEGRHGQRLILWVSLEGPVLIPPRVDRNPYIRLDVETPWRRITVWEGDMWNRQGASRPAEPLTLEGLTTQNVAERVVAVVRRTVERSCMDVKEGS